MILEYLDSLQAAAIAAAPEGVRPWTAELQRMSGMDAKRDKHKTYLKEPVLKNNGFYRYDIAAISSIKSLIGKIR